MLRQRLVGALRIRGGASTTGSSRWTSPGHEERPKGYLFNRTPLPPGQSRKWEDWELPCYITSFLTIVILGVGLNAKPDLTIETWAHQKALERLQLEASSSSGSSESDWVSDLLGGNGIVNSDLNASSSFSSLILMLMIMATMMTMRVFV